MAAIMLQEPPFLKMGGTMGPHFIILDSSLRLCDFIDNHIALMPLLYSSLYVPLCDDTV